MTKAGTVAIALVLTALSCGGTGRALAQQEITFGLPGIPPVFVSVQPLVAQQEKLFEKYGVKVTLRPFDTGAAAARAVIAGDIDMSITPTALVANMISNANTPIVTIYGYEKPTWRIASTDPQHQM